MHKINGFKIFENTHLMETVFTKKQTRKLKNRRWVKKYKKKYTRYEPSTKVYFDLESRIVIMHPLSKKKLIQKLKNDEVKEQKTYAGGDVFKYPSAFEIHARQEETKDRLRPLLTNFSNKLFQEQYMCNFTPTA